MGQATTKVVWSFSKLFALLLLISAGGCASVAKGVTSAVLDRDSVIDDHLCRVDGVPFKGVSELIGADDPTDGVKTVRMLFVHGIGEHSENYSESFSRQLARGVGLTNRDRKQKRIKLGMARDTGAAIVHLPGDDLGSLLVTRYMNELKTKELLTFELLWSDYNEDARNNLIETDKDTAKLRASVNDLIKTFFNKQIVDPVKYLGDNSPAIRGHVKQASCWMLSANWDSIKSGSRNSEGQVCPLLQADPQAEETRQDVIANDELIAVTHSLGSRIFLDAFTIQNDERDQEVNPFSSSHLGGALSGKEVTVIMLANQLPLLQQGLSDEEGFSWPGVPWKNKDRYNGNWRGMSDRPVRQPWLSQGPMLFNKYDSKEELCSDQTIFDRETGLGSLRRFRKMNLISVSDPNDLLSYRLLGGEFVDDYVDWRLCADVSEVMIAVSPATSLLGIQLANPSDAHQNYWTDPGLSELLLHGTKGHRQINTATNRPNDLVFSFDQKGRKMTNSVLLVDNRVDESRKMKSRYQCEVTLH